MQWLNANVDQLKYETKHLGTKTKLTLV